MDNKNYWKKHSKSIGKNRYNRSKSNKSSKSQSNEVKNSISAHCQRSVGIGSADNATGTTGKVSISDLVDQDLFLFGKHYKKSASPSKSSGTGPGKFTNDTLNSLTNKFSTESLFKTKSKSARISNNIIKSFGKNTGSDLFIKSELTSFQLANNGKLKDWKSIRELENASKRLLDHSLGKGKFEKSKYKTNLNSMALNKDNMPMLGTTQLGIFKSGKRNPIMEKSNKSQRKKRVKETTHCIKLGKRKRPLSEAKSEKIKVGDVDIQLETIKTKSGTTELRVFAVTPEDSSNSCLDVTKLKRITSDNVVQKQLIIDLTLKKSLISELKPKSMASVQTKPKSLSKSKSASLLKVIKSAPIKRKTEKSKSNPVDPFGITSIKYFGQIIPQSAKNHKMVTWTMKSGSGKQPRSKSLNKVTLIGATGQSYGKTGKSKFFFKSKTVKIKSAASIRSNCDKMDDVDEGRNSLFYRPLKNYTGTIEDLQICPPYNPYLAGIPFYTIYSQQELDAMVSIYPCGTFNHLQRTKIIGSMKNPDLKIKSSSGSKFKSVAKVSKSLPKTNKSKKCLPKSKSISKSKSSRWKSICKLIGSTSPTKSNFNTLLKAKNKSKSKSFKQKSIKSDILELSSGHLTKTNIPGSAIVSGVSKSDSKRIVHKSQHSKSTNKNKQFKEQSTNRTMRKELLWSQKIKSNRSNAKVKSKLLYKHKKTFD